MQRWKFKSLSYVTSSSSPGTDAWPPELRPLAQEMAEMATGVRANDVEIILKNLDAKAGKSAKEDDVPSEELTEEEKEKRRKEEQKAAMKAARDAAVATTRIEARRLAGWVRGGPCTLRVLNFLCAASIAFAGGVGIFIETFNKFRVFHIVLEFYLLIFGIALASVDVKSAACSHYVAGRVQKYFEFLSLSLGRGLFFLFVGLLSLSLWDESTGGWTEILSIISGFAAVGLAFVNCAAGCIAQRRLKNAAGKIASEESS